MAEVKVDPPPLKAPVADPRTGMPTKSLTDFLYRLWRRTGGNTDRASELQSANEQIQSLAESGLSLAEQSQRLAEQNQSFTEQVQSQAQQGQQTAQEGVSLAQQAFGVAQEALTLAKLGQVPIGGVMPFTGSTSDVPENWSLCDGSNGTPDLTDMFILGAGGNRQPGDVGGQEKVQLSVAEMPKHGHDVEVEEGGDHSHNATAQPSGEHSHPVPVFSGSPTGNGAPARGGAEDGTVGAKPSGSHGHNVDISDSGPHSHPATAKFSGGDQPHENMPPFYALALITRIE